MKGLYSLVEQFKKGTSVNQLLKARSAFIDNILKSSWSQHSVSSGASLIAVGGYGRSELQPFSDVDILILVDDDTSTDSLETWIAFLWDIGLEVGHSVRTLNVCETLAKEDITVATSLLESRLLCGTHSHYKQLIHCIEQESFWPNKEFFKAKLREQQHRHSNFKDTSFNLEPNIKSTPGGLRDLQVIQWIALKQFKANSLFPLVGLDIFTRREYKALIGHQQFLNRVRFALHAITRKREDRLLFEHQKNVATWLGFEDDDKKLAVEQLMQQYYRSVMVIRNLNGLFLQIFEQRYLMIANSPNKIKLDDNFYLQDNRIGTLDDHYFEKKPHGLIQIFTHIAVNQEIKGIEAKTLRTIRSNHHLLLAKNRDQSAINISIQEFLSAKQFTSRGFALMKRTNVLASILPMFGKIEGQMQFDLFHAYTVDEHTLFLLRYIVRYNRESCKDEFPICSEIMNSLENYSVIHLAALFHDIAKGRGGDHSELGALDALDYCLKIGLSQDDSELVAWLVKNHLLMSMVAQRKDISDPEVIDAFGQRIPSIKHLELLYVLTVSDIRATNPTLWNSWKESLLKELFLSSKHYLSHTAPRSNFEEMLQDNKQQIFEQLLKLQQANKQINRKSIEQLLDTLGDDYLLRYHPEQVVWQLTNLHLHNPHEDGPLVSVKQHRNRSGSEVFIAMTDQPHIFAAITAILSKLNLNIQAATLFTSDSGLCLDTFIVLDQDGKPLAKKEQVAEIELNLAMGLSDINNCSLDVNRALPSSYKHFNVPTKISFSQDSANNLTILELSALDRPALLAKMGQAFKDCNIKIHSAKIVTLGEKVEDTFSITQNNNKPIIKESDLILLEKRILELLDS